uniref:mixed lineage kinase domain-like protein n=1 Tax=Scatophagus argus TaxID=75038 RepID=UPI001ED80778|nr:mixed lineage kinase domain-like protein [Scatophagus argus]
MDFIDPILSVATQIYTLVENVKANKKRCRRVSDRVKALEELVRSIQQRGRGQTSADVENALKELCITLNSAQELIRKYTLANWMERILNSSSHGDEFNSVNERLNDAFQVLSGALQVEQGGLLYQVFELTSREKEDEVDGREDDRELKRLLLDHMKSQQEKTEAMMREFEHLKSKVENVMEMLSKPSITDEVIRMIKPDEIKYLDDPKVPFMTTGTSEVYRGEYHGFQVAVKRYTEPVNTSPREVRSVFNKEVETMKRFESPNILRMFGICVLEEDGPSPQFLIIMEYCEKGSLRQVLDSDCQLSWTRKACMCLDAAKGLYRLHQTEVKSKVHGCINSSKFLVAKDYTVKLGGFELAKTETSLKKVAKNKQTRSLCYSPPQMLSDINHVYSKAYEMYSFGVVLWEIATRRRPFEGFSDQDIYQKVCEEKFQEPLPADCPAALGHLIKACRAYDSFHRPSAGALVDKLRTAVAQLEDQ